MLTAGVLCALAVTGATGCRADTPSDSAPVASAAAPAGTVDLLTGLVYPVDGGDTVLEVLNQVGVSDDLLALEALAVESGALPFDPERLDRRVVEVGSEVVRATADPAERHTAWPMLWSLSVADRVDGQIDPATARRISDTAQALVSQGELDWFWLAQLRHVGAIEQVGTGASSCAALATALASKDAPLRAFDKFVAGGADICDDLADAVRDRVVSGRPTPAALLRICRVESCAGEIDSVRRFVADEVERVASASLPELSLLEAGDLAALAHLAGELDVDTSASAESAASLDALLRLNGLPPSLYSPSDLGVLMSVTLLDEAGLSVRPPRTSDGSLTADYAGALHRQDMASVRRALRDDAWDGPAWFVAGLEHERSGWCPSRPLRRGDLTFLDRYAADPSITSTQTAARAVVLLESCEDRSLPGLRKAIRTIAVTVAEFELSGREALSPANLWAAHVGLCLSGANPYERRSTRAARQYVHDVESGNAEAWDLREYFAAAHLARARACTGTQWFARVLD